MNIYLFCSAGMSTSLLVEKMKAAAKEQGVDCHIEAFAESTVGMHGEDADVILLGPQIRFREKSIKAQFPDKPVEPIDMSDYGMCEGAKVLKRALELAK